MLCEMCHSKTKDDTSSIFQVNTSNTGTIHSTVARLQEEMAVVDNMIGSLTLRRMELRRRINSMAPIARLPPELLVEIFALLQQTSVNGSLITPLFFGGICKEWRDIVWSAPLLWNSVYLHVSISTRASKVELLKDWLARAKSSPLHINVTSENEDDEVVSITRSVMEALVSRSKYWYIFDCILPSQCHDILENRSFPMLTSASVHSPKGTISTFSKPPKIFHSAPKLYDIELLGYHFPSISLPWDQLRRFKTQFLTVAESLKVLRRSPALKECHLDSVYSPGLLASPVLETIYSDLEILDVVLIKSAALSFFDRVALPSLRELRVSYTGSGRPLLSSIQALVLRSGSKLERLCIERISTFDDDLISCLGCIPSLTHLRLTVSSDLAHTSMGLSEKFMSLLSPFRHAAALLPNLVSLHYHGRVSCDGATFLSCLLTRQLWHDQAPNNETISRLSDVEITPAVPYTISPTAYDLLKELRATGLMITIHPSETI